MSEFLSTRQVAETFGQPNWLVRRIVDDLGGVPRIGGRRIVPRSLLPAIVAELEKRGKLAPAEASK